MMSCPPEQVPDWLLERLAAGELTAEQAQTLKKRLAAAGGPDRLTALAASNAEILAAHPPGEVMAEVGRRAGVRAWRVSPPSRLPTMARRLFESRRVPRPVMTLSFATAGVVALSLCLFRGPAKPSRSDQALGPQEQETIANKGLQPSLGLYRKTETGIERLGATARLRKGDVVQMRYIAAGRGYGVVASCDARETVTLHLPETGGPAATLIKDGERALAHSYELDDSPGFERFVFVTADTPFPTDLVARHLAQGTALPSGFSVWSLTLDKETP